MSSEIRKHAPPTPRGSDQYITIAARDVTIDMLVRYDGRDGRVDVSRAILDRPGWRHIRVVREGGHSTLFWLPETEKLEYLAGGGVVKSRR